VLVLEVPAGAGAEGAVPEVLGVLAAQSSRGCQHQHRRSLRAFAGTTAHRLGGTSALCLLRRAVRSQAAFCTSCTLCTFSTTCSHEILQPCGPLPCLLMV